MENPFGAEDFRELEPRPSWRAPRYARTRFRQCIRRAGVGHSALLPNASSPRRAEYRTLDRSLSFRVPRPRSEVGSRRRGEGGRDHHRGSPGAVADRHGPDVGRRHVGGAHVNGADRHARQRAAKMRGPWPYVLAVAVRVVPVVALAAALGPTLRYVRMRPVVTLRGAG